MGFYGGYYDEYPRYVPVAERRRQAEKKLAALSKKGLRPAPVKVAGRAIAQTFWGKSWCEHLEGYADYANRLERGRTYVRNGSVVHLELGPGRVKALVSGSEVYEVEATVKPLPPARWRPLVEACAGQVASVVELLSGQLAGPVMQVLCDRQKGLFPSPREIAFTCSCPDAASMCKHVAAVLYGVGARLDTAPELLFTLRQVEGGELVSRAATGLAETGPAPTAALEAGGAELAGLFGIELAGGEAARTAEAAATAVPAPAPAGTARAEAGREQKKAAAVRSKGKQARGEKASTPRAERVPGRAAKAKAAGASRPKPRKARVATKQPGRKSADVPRTGRSGKATGSAAARKGRSTARADAGRGRQSARGAGPRARAAQRRGSRP